MRRWLVALLLPACASSGLHKGPTALVHTEKAALAGAPEKKDGGFGRFWPKAAVRGVGLLKWDVRSTATAGAPAELLELIRDEVGRLNQKARAGEDVLVSVTVYRVERRFFGGLEVGVEVVGRDSGGRLVWAGDEVVRPKAEQARNLADTAEVIVAREVARKLGKELGL